MANNQTQIDITGCVLASPTPIIRHGVILAGEWEGCYVLEHEDGQTTIVRNVPGEGAKVQVLPITTKLVPANEQVDSGEPGTVKAMREMFWFK